MKAKPTRVRHGRHVLSFDGREWTSAESPGTAMIYNAITEKLDLSPADGFPIVAVPRRMAELMDCTVIEWGDVPKGVPGAVY